MKMPVKKHPNLIRQKDNTAIYYTKSRTQHCSPAFLFAGPLIQEIQAIKKHQQFAGVFKVGLALIINCFLQLHSQLLWFLHSG